MIDCSDVIKYYDYFVDAITMNHHSVNPVTSKQIWILLDKT